MALHIFGAVVTPPGVAANNRGETEGNITTLQKLLWNGQVHTTVSAEAIRWALRYNWQLTDKEVNRFWNDEKGDHEWQDAKWQGWTKADGKTYIDDDLLGYMKAEGAKSEGEQGRTDKRRGVLEIARAISTAPFVGDITFNARSGDKDRTSLYGAEIHATRYQYGFALTPARLRQKERVVDAIEGIANLGEVAGNHSRFLFDFSPESIVLRITDDPAPRILYCFHQTDDGHIQAPELVRKVCAGDIEGKSLYIGGPLTEDEAVANLLSAGEVHLYQGIKETVRVFVNEVKSRMGLNDAK